MTYLDRVQPCHLTSVDIEMARKDASGWVPDAPICSGQLRKHIIGVFCKVLKQHYLELSVRLDPGWGPS